MDSKEQIIYEKKCDELQNLIQSKVNGFTIYIREYKDFNQFFLNKLFELCEKKDLSELQAVDYLIINFERLTQDFRMIQVRIKKQKGYKGY